MKGWLWNECKCLDRDSNPVFRNGFGGDVRIFAAGGIECYGTKGDAWICCRCDGGGIRMVFADSCYGFIGAYGQVGICSGSGRLFAWNCVSACFG